MCYTHFFLLEPGNRLWVFLFVRWWTSLKMLLFYSYLKSELFASLSSYVIFKDTVNIIYLTFCTSWYVVQLANRFSDNCNFCGISEENLNIHRTETLVNSLREKFPYSELFWSTVSNIQTEYREVWSISLYSIQMRENTDQSNSEYGHFYAVILSLSFIILHFEILKNKSYLV